MGKTAEKFYCGGCGKRLAGVNIKIGLCFNCQEPDFNVHQQPNTAGSRREYLKEWRSRKRAVKMAE